MTAVIVTGTGGIGSRSVGNQRGNLPAILQHNMVCQEPISMLQLPWVEYVHAQVHYGCYLEAPPSLQQCVRTTTPVLTLHQWC